MKDIFSDALGVKKVQKVKDVLFSIDKESILTNLMFGHHMSCVKNSQMKLRKQFFLFCLHILLAPVCLVATFTCK